MTTVVLRVETAGRATVQDLGRPGLAHLGIAQNGASDGWAAQTASLLAGNARDAALVEITGSAFGFVADADLLLAVTGAAPYVLVDGVPQPVWETLVVHAGRAVTIPAPDQGLRSYLAVNGRLDAPPVLGSVAPDRLLGVGVGVDAGDTLTVSTSFAGVRHPWLDLPVFRMGVRPARHVSPLVVGTTRGPDAHEFPGLADQGLPGTYEVSPQSDTIGLRLLGPTPERTTSAEILSRGVPVGAIEVPPGGGLLLLLRGRLVTAGYPVVGVATLAGIDRLGQARPGDTVRFAQVDAASARAEHGRRTDELDRLADRVRTALSAAGLGQVLSR